jgi:hypothetical protein
VASANRAGIAARGSAGGDPIRRQETDPEAFGHAADPT